MADIRMCSGLECPLKESCYRHTATPNEYRQSYFIEPPFINVKVKGSIKTYCEHYWDNKGRKK